MFLRVPYQRREETREEYEKNTERKQQQTNFWGEWYWVNAPQCALARARMSFGSVKRIAETKGKIASSS